MFKKLSVLFFILFLCLVILGSSNYLLTKVAGIDLKGGIGFSLLYVSILSLSLAFFTTSFSDNIVKSNSFLVNLILLYALLNLVYGIFNGNQITIIFEEFWVILVVFLAYKVSLNKDIWSSFRVYVYLLFVITVIILYIGLNQTRQYLDELDIVSASVFEETTSSLAYELVSLTDFWPFIFAILFFREGLSNKILAFIPFVLYVILQLYFLKRAPAVRAVFQISIFFLIAALRRNRIKDFIKVIPIVVLLLCLFYLVLPQGLIDRFKDDDGSRPDELLNMIYQFNLIEILIGKGMGGAYISDNGIYDYIDIQTGNEMRTTVHIGIAYPILKGGLIFFSIIFTHISIILIKALKYLKYSTSIEIASYGFLLVFCLFRLIEGPINAVSIFNGIMFGMSIGSLERFIDFHKTNHVESISNN